MLPLKTKIAKSLLLVDQTQVRPSSLPEDPFWGVPKAGQAPVGGLSEAYALEWGRPGGRR